MTLEQELAQFGLSGNEVSVYLAVLELGEPLVGDIAKKTSLHKQLIYNAAGSLQERGLMNVHEVRGRKRFRIENPEALEDNLRTQLKKAQELIPQLYARANTKRTSAKVRTYRGVKGVQQYYIESMRKQSEESMVAILGVNSKRYFELFPQDGIAYARFERLRIERKVHLQLVLFGTQQEENELNKYRKYVEFRLLTDAVQGPMDIMIWHDHVGMLFYGDDPYVLDVIGQETVQGFREYVQILWEKDK